MNNMPEENVEIIDPDQFFNFSFDNIMENSTYAT